MREISFDAVLFDMDNTLHSLYEARFCAANGVMAYKECFPNLMFYSLNRDTPDLVQQSLANFYQENNLTNVEEGMWLYRELEIACIRPFTEMKSLILRLKKEGKKLAIITNADKESTSIRIQELELEGIFNIIVTPETFGMKKPHREVYQKTLEYLGVTKNRAIMIGDKISRDVLPAREAGLFAIHAWFGSLDEKDTIACAETPEDVEKLLESFQI